MREILCFMFDFAAQLGITPAYAGNTFYWCVCFVLVKDHPRVCGKYIIAFVMVFCASGSPPRMREIPVLLLANAFCSGITPAYAGNTISNINQIIKFRDHPRVCGKYIYIIANH